MKALYEMVSVTIGQVKYYALTKAVIEEFWRLGHYVERCNLRTRSGESFYVRTKLGAVIIPFEDVRREYLEYGNDLTHVGALNKFISEFVKPAMKKNQKFCSKSY